MSPGDRIVAAASAPGRSARAVVRLSGPGTRAALGAVLETPAEIPERGGFVARMRLGEGVMPVLVCVYKGPRSYTGEDAAEMLVPGNPVVVERVIAALCAGEGVRLAGPGEFSARAYLHDRLSLDRAEGVAAVIAARTEEELTAARSLLAGAVGSRYRAWADELATLLALVEAGIDFSDQEDVVPIAPADLKRRLALLGVEIAGFLGGSAGREARRELPRVALFGGPNAGKSTLFNALLGRRRAVVSPTAGTTRDVLEEELDLAGDAPGTGRVLLMDAAGVEEAARGLEAEAQGLSKAAAVGADVVVHCDPSGRFAESAPGRRVIRVRTKADLGASGGEREGAIAVCAIDGWNLPALRRAIADAAWGAGATGVAALVSRHRRALEDAVVGLQRAEASVDGGARALADPALVAAEVREPLNALGELVGKIDADSVIGRIFATFCVGK